jgi:hypothetical protein
LLFRQRDPVVLLGRTGRAWTPIRAGAHITWFPYAETASDVLDVLALRRLSASPPRG